MTNCAKSCPQFRKNDRPLDTSTFSRSFWPVSAVYSHVDIVGVSIESVYVMGTVYLIFIFQDHLHHCLVKHLPHLHYLTRLIHDPQHHAPTPLIFPQILVEGPPVAGIEHYGLAQIREDGK